VNFDRFVPRILEEDKSRPAKQQHTAKRIFERLHDEYGYGGGITIVRAYVHERRQRLREVFVLLSHDPGRAQVDFGEALAVIAGKERKIHFFAMDPPHSDGCAVQAYPAETTEAFCDAHNVSFAFFGRVPRSMLYDTPSWRWRASWVTDSASARGPSASCSRTIRSGDC
jgi:transposase